MGKKGRPPDRGILTTILTILIVGLFMVFSASYYEATQDSSDPYYYLKRQLIWSLIGLVAMYVISRVDYWKLGGYSRYILFIAIILLILVAIPGIGRESRGSRRWLGFGQLGFQPSEVAKLAMVFYLAWFFSQGKVYATNIKKGILPFLGVIGLVGFLIMLQPDLGTAVSIAGTGFVMLFAAGAPLTYLAGIMASAIPGVFALIFTEDYRRRRFLSFLDPWKDPLGTGYHIIQGLYALGSGGLFGLGLTQSRQKYFYLPERHTDFIFAILGEELGFIGSLTLLVLFTLFAWRGYRVALTAPDTMSSLLAVGLTTMVLIQVIINIGVVTSILPITGITLPFVSFGGSSLVFSLAGVGLLLNVSRYCRY